MMLLRGNVEHLPLDISSLKRAQDKEPANSPASTACMGGICPVATKDQTLAQTDIAVAVLPRGNSRPGRLVAEIGESA